MKTYLTNLLAEKNIDLETPIEVEGNSGTNFMTVENVYDGILATTKTEQEQIRKTLVRIDFMNGDILHFIKHLAKAMAI